MSYLNLLISILNNFALQKDLFEFIPMPTKQMQKLVDNPRSYENHTNLTQKNYKDILKVKLENIDELNENQKINLSQSISFKEYNSTDFTEPSVFKRIYDFINSLENRINEKDKKVANIIINKLRDIRRKDFKHGGVLYSFHCILKRLENIKNNNLRNSLNSYLIDILNSRFPHEVFKAKTSLRASNFLFIGTANKIIKTENIEKFFKKCVKDSSHRYGLLNIIKDISNKLKSKLIHPTVLFYLL